MNLSKLFKMFFFKDLESKQVTDLNQRMKFVLLRYLSAKSLSIAELLDCKMPKRKTHFEKMSTLSF